MTTFTDAGMVPLRIVFKGGEATVDFPVFETDAEIRLVASRLVAENEKREKEERLLLSTKEMAEMYRPIFDALKVPELTVGGYLHLVDWVQQQVTFTQKKTLYFESAESPSSTDSGHPMTNGSSER